MGVRVELLKWEDVHPGISSSTQTVIDQQIGPDYDVFLGIFWSRLGSAAQDQKSGSMHEFEQAFARYKRDPSSVELMIYFKDEPIAPTAVDPDQLKALQQFKSDLPSKGVLYHEVKSLQDFENAAQVHLSQYIAKFLTSGRSVSVVEESRVKAHAAPSKNLVNQQTNESPMIAEYEVSDRLMGEILNGLDGRSPN